VTVPSLTSGEWGERLAERFFRPEYAGTYVLFYVDRPLLAELAGVEEDEAASSLVAAVMPQLRLLQPRDLFGPLLKEAASWKVGGVHGPPPCLAALALAVLAASEMRREGGRSSTNYHAWFGDLMALGVPDLDRDLLWGAYADAYPTLWVYLQWWLDEHHRGTLGRSTIAEDEHNTKYGFADSQTIFLSSDREKLSRFFRWIRLNPGDDMPSEELLQYFRIWAGRRDNLSPGASRMLEEEQLEHLQLGRLIAEAAARWDGGVHDDEGRLEARLALTLTRPPRSRLGLAAPCPAGFPPQLELDHQGQAFALMVDLDAQLAADEHLWYGALPLEVSKKTLGAGLRLEAEGRVLRFAPQSYYVLHMSRELGCWASAEQILPSTPAWILVADEQLDEVSELLERRARPGWRPIERDGIVPAGWSLIRDVVIDPVEGADREGLSRLLPRLSNRFALGGGLPLPRGSRVYLTEGDPDLMLPPMPEDAPPLAIELDRTPIALAPGASLLSLSALAPPEGNHLVQIGSVRRQYSTLRTLGSPTPLVEKQVGHELRMIDGCLQPTSLDATRDPQLTDTGARVIGSLVEVGASVGFEEADPQLILPRGALRRVLVSEQPGLLESVEVPEEPGWMRRAGLECQSFEHLPSIDAQWLITESRLGGLRVRRIEAVPASGPGLGEKRVAAWAQLVLACGQESVEPADCEDWERLQALAGSAWDER
jgi:hypothetical protein